MNERQRETTDRVRLNVVEVAPEGTSFQLTTEANNMKVSETTEQLIGVHLETKRGGRGFSELGR